MPLDLVPAKPERSYYHPKNYYKIYSRGVELGDLFMIHPNSSDKVEENCTIVGVEINFSKLVQIDSFKVEFCKISKYPTTKLDFNFIIPQEKFYRDINACATSIQTDLNYTVTLLDIYDNANGTKSYTLHYEVNSLDRTLTSEDIDKFHKAVISNFAKQGYELKL